MSIRRCFMGGLESEVIKGELAAQAAKMEDLSGADLPAGHPVSLLRAENTGLEAILDRIQEQCGSAAPDSSQIIEALRQFNGSVRTMPKKKNC